MNDLRQRFAALDRMPVPDVWPEVERRLEGLEATTRADVVAVTPKRRAFGNGPSSSETISRGRRSVALLVAASLVGVLLVGTGIIVGSGRIRFSAPLPAIATSPQATSPQTTAAPSTAPAPPSASPIPSSRPVAAGPGSWALARIGRNAGVGGGTATLLEDGRVLFTGGEDAAGGSATMASAELFDPVTGRSSETGSMHAPRRGHTATLLRDGRVLVAGGWDLGSGQASPTAVAELYDPATGTWTETGSMTRWRQHPTATLLVDGRVLVVGGYVSSGGITRGAEIYDPQTGTWRSTAAMSAPPASATRLPDGRVLVLHAGRITPELFDPATGHWTATTMPLQVGAAYRATLLPNGTVFVLSVDGGSIDAAELYDPATGTWTMAVRPPTGTGPAALMSDGSVMVVDMDSAARYDPASGTWTAMTPPPQPSYFESGPLIQLADGRMLATDDGIVGVFDPTRVP